MQKYLLYNQGVKESGLSPKQKVSSSNLLGRTTFRKTCGLRLRKLRPQILHRRLLNRKFLPGRPRIIDFADIGVHPLNGSANRAWNFLHVEAGHVQPGMAEVGLCALLRAVPLEVGRERSAHRLEDQIRNVAILADRLRYPLEVVPDSKWRASFGRKQEIVWLGVGRDVIRVAYRAHPEPRAKFFPPPDRSTRSRCSTCFSYRRFARCPSRFLSAPRRRAVCPVRCLQCARRKLLSAQSAYNEESHDQMFA